MHFTPFSFFMVSNVGYEYGEFDSQLALTAAQTGLHQPIVSYAALLSASRMTRGPRGGVSH